MTSPMTTRRASRTSFTVSGFPRHMLPPAVSQYIYMYISCRPTIYSLLYAARVYGVGWGWVGWGGVGCVCVGGEVCMYGLYHWPCLPAAPQSSLAAPRSQAPPSPWRLVSQKPVFFCFFSGFSFPMAISFSKTCLCVSKEHILQ